MFMLPGVFAFDYSIAFTDSIYLQSSTSICFYTQRNVLSNHKTGITISKFNGKFVVGNIPNFLSISIWDG